MFDVVFYKNESPIIKLDKKITKVGEYQLVIKNATDIINPVLILNDSLTDVITQSNYVYIKNWKRYYFITGITTVTGRNQEVHLESDVRMSFADDLLKADVIAESQEYAYNLYIDDGSFTAYQDPYTLTRKFSGGFSKDGSYILTVSGG